MAKNVFYFVDCITQSYLQNLFFATLVILVITLLLSKRLHVLLKTLPRDVRLFILYLRITRWSKMCARKNYTVSKVFSMQFEKHPDKVSLYFENESWTYRKIEHFSNKIANYFENEGYKRGDVVALLLENCAAYPALWLGLSKIGIVTALINTNLVKNSLLHCITTTQCKALIFGSSHIEAVSDIAQEAKSLRLYQFRNNFDERKEIHLGSVDLQQSLGAVPNLHRQSIELSYKDPVLYIFTSGTTGLPKAAVLSHVRLMTAIRSYKLIAAMTPDDVIYTPLPLYHSAGGVVGVGQALVSGSTVVIRKKFSATSYFKDCVNYNATIAQYVGEMCRYLLATPKNGPVNHKLRLLFGNGLKHEIWKPFVEQFHIQRVVEFYGATEGIANMWNIDNTTGAVGSIPSYLKWAFPITNIKCDETTGDPVRNAQGFCVECDVGKPGLLVAKVNTTKTMFNFEGYADQEASENKILHNVFRTGDTYFNSGDVLIRDELDYFYFKARTGDTFRWKSENVSTAEVEAVISNIVKLDDVAVYGVEVPYCEGKAGMAALVDQNNNLDIGTIGENLKRHLPNYAVPVFIRMMDSLPMTGTYKLRKTKLSNEGFDINNIKNVLYVYHYEDQKYIPLTKEIYKEIENGKLKL